MSIDQSSGPDSLVTPEIAAQRHKGQWILMEVKEFDESKDPMLGLVRLASKSRRRITDESVRIRDSRRDRGEGCSLYVFHSAVHEPAPVDLPPSLEY